MIKTEQKLILLLTYYHCNNYVDKEMLHIVIELKHFWRCINILLKTINRKQQITDTVVLKIIQPPLLFPMTSIETSRATLIVVLTVCFRSIKI